MVQELILSYIVSGRWVCGGGCVGNADWAPFLALKSLNGCSALVPLSVNSFSSLLHLEQFLPWLFLANSTASPGQTLLSLERREPNSFLYLTVNCRVGGQSSLSFKIPFMPIIQHTVAIRMKRLPFGLSKKSILLTLLLVTKYPGLRKAFPDCRLFYNLKLFKVTKKGSTSREPTQIPSGWEMSHHISVYPATPPTHPSVFREDVYLVRSPVNEISQVKCQTQCKNIIIILISVEHPSPLLF